MREAKDLMQLLKGVEDLTPLDELTVDGICVWPILRIYTAYRLRELNPDSMTPSRQPRWYKRWMSKRAIPRMQSAEGNMNHLEKVDFLTLAHPSHRTDMVEGKAFNRYLDPLHHFLAPQKGIHLEALFSEDNLKASYYSPTYSLLSRLEESRLARGSSRNKWSGGMYVWCKEMQELFSDTYFHPENVAYWLDIVEASVPMFKAILEEAEAKVLFVSAFYDPVLFGALRAANELGIPAVDVQHGVQGAYHFAYNGYRGIPPSAYTYLPSRFWHYTQADIDQTSQSFDPERTKHQLMGNQWMEFWKEEVQQPSAKEHPFTILYTLGISESLLDEQVLFAMKANPDYRWYVRMHPRALHRLKEVETELQAAGITNYEVKDANSLPIFELLSQSKVHVTRQSTVALEALDFQVPTLLTSTNGFDYYNTYLDKGWMRVFLGNEQWPGVLGEGFLEGDGSMHYVDGVAFNPARLLG
jgi:hypothetical protein